MTIPSSLLPEYVPAQHVYDFDIFQHPPAGSTLQDVYLDMANRAPPIFYTPANGGHWVFTRRRDYEFALKNYHQFSSSNMQIPRADDHVFKLIPVELDPPLHTRYRKLLAGFFSSSAIQEFEPSIRTACSQLIDGLEGRTSCKFVSEVATPLPVKFFMSMMGLPLDRYEEFRSWVVEFMTVTTTEDRDQVVGKVLNYFATLIELRRAAPGQDLVSRLLAAEIEGESVPDMVVLSLCMMLFVAGLDTVTTALTAAVQHLARDMELQSRLRAEPDRIPAFVEEALRRYSFSNTIRTAAYDFDYDGVSFRQGDMIFCATVLAGLDSEAIEHPLEVDIDRVKAPFQLAFGAGAHRCAGIHLARIEMQLLLEVWLSRVEFFSLSEAGLGRQRGGIVGSIEELDLKINLN